MKTKMQKGKKLAIWALATGWFMPILGLILGIIARVKAKDEDVQTLASVSIVESIFFWIFWMVIFS
jgi:hypothetical protein